jgi:hypothetical protein
MTTLKTTDISKSQDALRAALAEDVPTPVVLTRKGKAVAALIPMTDDDVESLALSLNPKFIEIIERSRASLAKDGGMSLEEVEAMFANDLTNKNSKTA